MNSTLAKCSCSHCDGHLEFDTAYAGERVTCPHCGKETLLHLPGTAIAPPTPSPAQAPANPTVQSVCRLADPTGSPTPAPRRAATSLRDAPPRNPNPFARQAARASWISFIFAYGFAAMLRGLEGTPQKPFFLLAAPLFALIGVTLGVMGLRGIRKHGRKGILIPAVVGIVLNGAVLSTAILGLVLGLSKRHEPHETAAPESTSTQSVTQVPVQEKAPVKTPPRAGEPIVTLLQPGAEPRRVLRLQPKAGDKQRVAFTMKTATDPSPVTNMPPIAMTRQITIKNVSPGGDIGYESVVTEISMLAGSGPTTPVMESLKPAFARLKGQTTAGVTSSRGFSISSRTETRRPKSGGQLPAAVRMFQAQMDEAVDIIAAPLPEEAVGAGGKWEVKQESRDGAERAVYEIVSIEKNRLTAKITFTASASQQKADGFAVTGRGSGDMTIDLARIMPAKANLVYRVEMSGTDMPGRTNTPLKMRMDLRMESK